MNAIRSLRDLEQLVKKRSTPRLVVAAAQDEDTLRATEQAVREEIVNVTLVGDRERIQSACRTSNICPDHFEIEHEAEVERCGDTAMRLIASGEADILMKGLIATPLFFKAILNKDLAIIPEDTTISHSALIEVKAYKKLLIISDVAMIPEPDLKQKIKIINYNIKVAEKLGILNPKIALIAANEKVSDRMPATTDAAIIAKMADRGQIKGAVIDGPLALDVAISKKACDIKGFQSPIDGYADILIFPNIETGNVFYKSLAILGQAKPAGILIGTPFPVVVTSRADDDTAKYHSIVLAAAVA